MPEAGVAARHRAGADIRAAATRIAGRVHRTPILTNRTLSALTGVQTSSQVRELPEDRLVQAARVRSTVVLSLDQPMSARAAWSPCPRATTRRPSRGRRASCGVPCDGRDAGRRAAARRLDAVPQLRRRRSSLHADRATLFDRLREGARAHRTRRSCIHSTIPVVLAGAGTVGLEIVEDVPDVDVRDRPGRRRRADGRRRLRGEERCVPSTRVVAVELEPTVRTWPRARRRQAGARRRAPPARSPTASTPPFVGALPLEIARDATSTRS